MARARTERIPADEQAVGLEAQLHVALDNLPGALVYTDDELNIVLCNDRFREMYPAPKALLEPGQPYPNFLRHLAENGYYGEGDLDATVRVTSTLWSPGGWRACATRPARRSRITHPTAVSMRSTAVGQRRAVRLR